MMQDLACLLKIEPLLWDVWGKMLSEKVDDLVLMDQLSDVLLNYSEDYIYLNHFYNENIAYQLHDSVLVDPPFLSSNWISAGDFYAKY